MMRAPTELHTRNEPGSLTLRPPFVPAFPPMVPTPPGVIEPVPSVSGRRIIVEERRVPGQPVIRRYRPAKQPGVWEINVACDADGMESFAYRLDTARRSAKIEIRRHPGDTRPTDLHDARRWQGSELLTKDPFFDDRFRFQHAPHRRCRWFIIEVSGADLDDYHLFEHPTMYGRFEPAGPLLPAPASVETAMVVPKSRELLRLETYEEAQRRTEAEVGKTRSEIAELREELRRLREEVPELIRNQDRYTRSDEGITVLLSEVAKITNGIKAAHTEIDAIEGLDEDIRRDLHDIADGALQNVLAEFKESVLRKLKRSHGGRP